MGPLDKFDPTAAVTLWMAKKNRRCNSNVKTHQQSWFNGVFDEANNESEEKRKKMWKPIIKF